MVDIKGYARYLPDTALSRNVARVSLTFKETTVYRELTEDALHHIDFEDVLMQLVIAVIGVQYGGISIMVLERNVKGIESKWEIEGAFSLALKAIVTSKDGNVNLSSNEKESSDNIKCTVYSDLLSNTKIVNWDGASAICKKFPTIFSASCNYENDIAVPVKVWLLPKKFLGSLHHIVIKEVPSSFFNKSKKII